MSPLRQKRLHPGLQPLHELLLLARLRMHRRCRRLRAPGAVAEARARAQRRRSSGSSGHARRGCRASREAQDPPLDAREAQCHFLHSPLTLSMLRYMVP